MFENLVYIIAIGLVLLGVLLSIYYIIIVPSRTIHLNELLETQDYENAELFLKDILQKEPHNIQIMFDLAELYWKMNRLYDAIPQYEELLLKNPSKEISNLVNYRLACWHKEEQQYPLAQEKLELLLQSEPNNTEYLSALGDVFFYTKNYTSAVKVYKQSLALDKNNPTAWKRLGDCYFNGKMYLDAYKAYAYAVHFSKKDPELWFQIAESCFHAQDYDKAINFYLKTENFTDSYYSFKATVRLAEIYNIKHLQPLYVQHLEKAKLIIKERDFLPFDMNDKLEVYYQLGEYYLKTNNIELALKEWETILALNPLYKDVNEKFNLYYSARIHDFFKDILTSQGEILTEILVEFVKKQGFSIDSIQYHGDESVDFYVSENSSKWRNSKRKKEIISFWCIDEPIPTDIVIRLTNKINSHDVSHIVIISAGPILSETRNILSRKSVDIYDQKNLQEFIHERKKAQNF